MDQVLKDAKASQVFYVPGEHDVLGDDGKQYLERYGKGTKGGGWYSFDQQGRAFHRPGERPEPQGRGTRHAWVRSNWSGWKMM